LELFNCLRKILVICVGFGVLVGLSGKLEFQILFQTFSKLNSFGSAPCLVGDFLLRDSSALNQRFRYWRFLLLLHRLDLKEEVVIDFFFGCQGVHWTEQFIEAFLWIASKFLCKSSDRGLGRHPVSLAADNRTLLLLLQRGRRFSSYHGTHFGCVFLR
jgi:hypothetical protein